MQTNVSSVSNCLAFLFFRMNFFSIFSKKTQENILLHLPWASLPLCKLESDINGYPTGQMMLLKFLELFFKKRGSAA